MWWLWTKDCRRSRRVAASGSATAGVEYRKLRKLSKLKLRLVAATILHAAVALQNDVLSSHPQVQPQSAQQWRLPLLYCDLWPMIFKSFQSVVRKGPRACLLRATLLAFPVLQSSVASCPSLDGPCFRLPWREHLYFYPRACCESLPSVVAAAVL